MTLFPTQLAPPATSAHTATATAGSQDATRMKHADMTLFPTDSHEDWIAFEYGAPGPDQLPTQLLATAAQHRFSQPDAHHSLQYGPVLGDRRLRNELAKFLSAEYGSTVRPENLCITNGASQSLSNIITLFSGPDTVIFIENPTYFLAIRVFEDHGFQRSDLVAIPTDSEGIDINVLREQLKKHAAAKQESALNGSGDHLEQSSKRTRVADAPQPPAGQGLKRFPFILYLVPTFSNPTGSTLGTLRRKELVDLAGQYDMLVVCDDVYQMHTFGDTNSVPQRVAAFDPCLAEPSLGVGNVISNCTFSKILGPGLRLGWVEAPLGIIKQYERSGIMHSGGCPNHMTATIVLSALELGLVSAHLKQMRETLASRCRAVCEVLRNELPPGSSFQEPSGGYFVWMQVPLAGNLSTVDVRDFLIGNAASHPTEGKVRGLDRVVRGERVSMTPGNAFSTDLSHGKW
eukprot:jgi/Hompol1/3014/HPOL_006296-RA